MSDLFGLLGTTLCFTVAFAYIWGCRALKSHRHE
jgi:hypothetical protein